MTVQLLFQWHVRQYAYSEVIHCSLCLCGDTFDPLPLLSVSMGELGIIQQSTQRGPGICKDY